MGVLEDVARFVLSFLLIAPFVFLQPAVAITVGVDVEDAPPLLSACLWHRFKAEDFEDKSSTEVNIETSETILVQDFKSSVNIIHQTVL